MKTVYLHGSLGECFGEAFELEVGSPAEAVRALTANLGPPFLAALRDGAFRVANGDDDLAAEQLLMTTGASTIHIEPVIAGAGDVFKVIAGIALVAAAFIVPGAQGLGAAVPGFLGSALGVTYGSVALFGVSLALSGVGGLLAPTPGVSDYGERERPDARPSFVFNGAVNTLEQGGPVPLVYGQHRVGSVVVSGGLDVVKVP